MPCCCSNLSTIYAVPVTDIEKSPRGGREAQLVSEPEETYRFEVELSCNREEDEYPEISFTDLIKGEVWQDVSILFCFMLAVREPSNMNMNHL